jgi:chromate transporter
MKSGGGVLLTLAGFFALMSLFAIGGANSAVPEIHRFAVNVQDWLSDRQFSESFALAQLTPGPNVILVTLIGYHVAGIVGAVVATFAMCGPTSVLAFFGRHRLRPFQGLALAHRAQPWLDPGNARSHRLERGGDRDGL